MIVFAVVLIFNIETKQVEDIAAVSGSLPPFHIPDFPFTIENFQIILPYGIIMAAVGLTEGLLTLNLVDEITNTKGRQQPGMFGSRKCQYSEWFFLRYWAVVR